MRAISPSPNASGPGERVPHFAQLDTQAAGMPDSQALFIRPALRLVGGHHYAVAITDRVKSASGGVAASVTTNEPRSGSLLDSHPIPISLAP
jgi:hypothetical protein